METNLTVKQDKFCLAYMETGNASKAYRQAYDNRGMLSATVNRKAKELMDNGKITARLEELKKALEDRHLWTRVQSVAALKLIAESKDSKAGDKIAAVKELNAMHGYNAPSKLEIAKEANPLMLIIQTEDGEILETNNKPMRIVRPGNT